MMRPFLLIGAGKVALNHFRHAGMLLGDGSPLKVFGIPDETVSRILQDKDVNRAGELLQKSLRNSPLWGSLYISRKALEWSRALDEAGEPFLKTEQDVRDFLDLPSPVRTKPWKMRDFPESEAVLKSFFLIRIMLRPEPSGCCVPVCPAWVKPPQRTGSLFMRRNRLPVWR